MNLMIKYKKNINIDT